VASKSRKFRYWLWPFSVVYGIGVRLRNLLFDCGLRTARTYPVPVICAGNLAVGGSGKTPMVEYLIRLLDGKYRVAVLSRGYRRKTAGFVLADASHTAADIGDECFQIKSKYPQITVAADGNRRRGIRRLLAMPDGVRPQVILMDDGFQHRRVQPSLSILLTDRSRLFRADRLLPVGRLREPAGAVRRANVVIVSKCDAHMEPAEGRTVRNGMNLRPHQSLFFGCTVYRPLRGVFPEARNGRTLDGLRDTDEVLLLTGIASPEALVEEVKKHAGRVKVCSFADHHAFRRKDIRKIQAELNKMTAENPLILCTEKDAARLRDLPYLPQEWRSRLYCAPVETRILFGRGRQLNRLILRHIRLTETGKVLQK
jgi:tetraacyldisaccharide 4'-kinase